MAQTPLVPEKTFAVCSNGLIKGEISVGSQLIVKTSDGRLLATEHDRPSNFKCVYLGLLIAAIGGIIAGLMASGVGTLLAGAAIATVIAAAMTYGVGGAVCAFCLKSAVWSNLHPNVKIKGYRVVTGKSQLICTPLGFLPSGTINLYYSEEVASRAANITAIQNITAMFAAAGMGAALPSITSALGSVFTASVAATGSTTIGGIAVISAGGGLYIGGDFVGKKIEDIENTASNILSGTQYKATSTGYVEAIANAPAEPLTPQTKKTYNTTKETQLKQYRIGSKSAIMTDANKKVNEDPTLTKKNRNQLKSKYMKETHAEYKQLSQRAAHKDGMYKAGGQALKNMGIVMGFSSAVNILSKTLTKSMQKELDATIEDAETLAKNKIKIYEKQI